MYKNFTLTESEREEILNRHKENGYGQPVPKVKFASNNTNQSKPTDTLAENKKIKNQKTNNMKVRKIVRLTESELKTYINKVIAEQSTPASKPVIPDDIPRTADSMKQLQDLVGKTVSIICDSIMMGCIITKVNQDERGVAYIFVNNKVDSKRNIIEFNPIKDTINFVDTNRNNIGDIFKGEFYGWLKKNVKYREPKYDFNSQNTKSPIKNNGSQV